MVPSTQMQTSGSPVGFSVYFSKIKQTNVTCSSCVIFKRCNLLRRRRKKLLRSSSQADLSAHKSCLFRMRVIVLLSIVRALAAVGTTGFMLNLEHLIRMSFPQQQHSFTSKMFFCLYSYRTLNDFSFCPFLLKMVNVK